MTDAGELYTRMEIDDNLSSITGTETLADRDLITPWLRQCPWSPNRRLTNRQSQIPESGTQCYPAQGRKSSLQKLLTPERNALVNDVIKATECLKAWCCVQAAFRW